MVRMEMGDSESSCTNSSKREIWDLRPPSRSPHPPTAKFKKFEAEIEQPNCAGTESRNHTSHLWLKLKLKLPDKRVDSGILNIHGTSRRQRVSLLAQGPPSLSHLSSQAT
eukprot:145917-Prorocentrum_minimum.AAC.5